jgi:ATP-dependent DNA ligase
VSEQSVSVHVCIFLFDIMLLQGDVLLQKTFRERRRALSKLFTALKPGHVELARSYELRVLTDHLVESQEHVPEPSADPLGPKDSDHSAEAPSTEVKTMTVRTTA